ncbi:MAG: serine/threonine phosphatase [Xenococcaceae cyanobacterium]
MLICPQCQFENPNTNNFCQRCGASMTHKTCHECGTSVPFSAENCHNCGAFTGTVWWAIISEQVAQEQSIAEEELEVTQEGVEEVEAGLPDSFLEKQDLTTKMQETDQSEAELAASAISYSYSYGERFANGEGCADGDEKRTDIASRITSEESELSPEAVVEEEEESEDRVKLSQLQLNGEYLDPGKRYRLKSTDSEDVLVESKSPSQFFQGRVVDCQPLEKPLLEVTLKQQVELLDEGEEKSEESDGLEASLWNRIDIPAIARPYLKLEEFSPIVPEVHDAWQEGNKGVVLLPDRSEWQLLSDLWENEDLPKLQILHWLDEMAQIWEALSNVGCCQSLLEESNLRVDEDQILCLQQLYPDPPDAQLTLQDLAQIWQLLLNKSEMTQYDSVVQLLNQIASGEIETLEQLRSQLQNIAREEQLSSQGDGGEVIDNSESDDMPTVVLPMQLLSLTDAGGTDIGRQRDHNEDYFGIDTQIKKQENNQGQKVQARGFYIVCDGMGGHDAGEVASAMAVQTLQSYFQTHWKDELPDKETIREGVLLANETIYNENQQSARSGIGRMGTTLVMALVQGIKVAIAHVGDSRIYRINRKWGLEQLTTDHEVGQQEILRGVEPKVAYSRHDAYQLTQALGPRDNNFVQPDIQFLELQEDTLLLLCSDGLSDNDLIETHWETYLTPLISSSANLEHGLLKLIDFANEHNGHDNITGLIVRVKVRPNLEQKPLF